MKGVSGSVFKLHRCPDCKRYRREKNPDKKAPPCKSCEGTNAYFSDDWYIAYTVPGQGDKVEAVSTLKGNAEKKLKNILEEIEEGRFEPYKHGLLWEDAKKIFLEFKENEGLRAETMQFYKDQVKAIGNYVEKFATTVEKIDEDVLKKIRTYRKEEVSPATVNKEIATIAHMCKLLSGRIMREVEGKKIPWLAKNPIAVPIKPLQTDPYPEVIWEPDELEKLLGATDDTFVRCYILMACMGALRKRTIKEFRREWIKDDVTIFVIPPSGRKRGKRDLKVTLADELAAELKRVWEGYRPYNYDAHKYYKKHKDTYYSDTPNPVPYKKGFLFCHPDDPEKQWNGFESLWRKLKIKIGVFKRFHDLKHTAGTFYQLANHDIKATMDFLDQTTFAMVLRYLHTIDEEREKNMLEYQRVLQMKKVGQVPKITHTKKTSDLWPQF